MYKNKNIFLDMAIYIDLDIPKPVDQKSTFTFCPLNKIYFTDFNNDIAAAI